MPVLGLEVLFEEGASGGADPRLTLFDRLIAKAAKKSIFTKYWAEGLNPRMMRNPPLPSTVLVLPPGFKLHCRPSVTDAGCRSRYWGRTIQQSDSLVLRQEGGGGTGDEAGADDETKQDAAPTPAPAAEASGGGGWGFSLDISAAVSAVASTAGAVDAPPPALDTCDTLKISGEDLMAFAGVPLISLQRFLDFATAEDDDEGEGVGRTPRPPADELPFEVSDHPAAQSSAARAMIQRMQEDVRQSAMAAEAKKSTPSPSLRCLSVQHIKQLHRAINKEQVRATLFQHPPPPRNRYIRRASPPAGEP